MKKILICAIALVTSVGFAQKSTHTVKIQQNESDGIDISAVKAMSDNGDIVISGQVDFNTGESISEEFTIIINPSEQNLAVSEGEYIWTEATVKTDQIDRPWETRRIHENPRRQKMRAEPLERRNPHEIRSWEVVDGDAGAPYIQVKVKSTKDNQELAKITVSTN